MPTSNAVPRTTDERLCWLAMRDYVDEKSRKVGLFRLFTYLGSGRRGGTRHGSDLRREQTSGIRIDYALAVDQAADRLSHDERLHLRTTGQVPDWFVEDVERRLPAIRKRK
ncbi:hypothetical protein [Streptacidiphilus albus]|uniref:hypothetical protein n=1 Tax=Streptacidiphilus albus TaxID=105425 RepID=UPI00054BAF08|nr:hypothetical protein [Streptacidiphilus albus]